MTSPHSHIKTIHLHQAAASLTQSKVMAEQNIGKTVLLLVRHGEYRTWPPTLQVLTPTGEEQSNITGDVLQKLAKKLPPIEGLYTSPLPRASQTANIIGNKFGFTTPIHLDKDLEERDPAAIDTLQRFDVAFQKYKIVDTTRSMTKILITHSNLIRHMICRYEHFTFMTVHSLC